MKIRSYSYAGNPLLDYMEKLSIDLKSPLFNHIIQIPEPIGEGFIKNINLEEGFCIRYYHFQLKHDLIFNWYADFNNVDPIFKLVFNLSGIGDECHQRDGSERGCVTENSTTLYSTDFVRTAMIKKNKWVNRVTLLFTKRWLENNFIEASDKIYEIVEVLLKKNKPTFISELMEQSHYLFVQNLACEMNREAFPVIHIKTKSLVLLNDFLTKLVDRSTSNINEDQSLYYNEIIRVENKLKEYFDKPMPNIDKLAKEFHLSTATLKRHFKIVYGKSIYHYYLEKKLALGKSLITEKKKSISEVAYTLGYNKINSFSKVFKKYYGVLPKDVNGMNGFF